MGCVAPGGEKITFSIDHIILDCIILVIIGTEELNKCYFEITKTLFQDPIQVAAYMFKHLKSKKEKYIWPCARPEDVWGIGGMASLILGTR